MGALALLVFLFTFSFVALICVLPLDFGDAVGTGNNGNPSLREDSVLVLGVHHEVHEFAGHLAREL